MSGVGDEEGGESKERIREQMKRKREEKRKRKRERGRERGGEEHKRTRLTGDRRKRTGGKMGLARRTFHGRRERPSGVALCHIQPPTTVGSLSFK